jgi:hypothetical protein
LRHLRATTQSQSVNQCQVFAGVQLGKGQISRLPQDTPYLPLDHAGVERTALVIGDVHGNLNELKRTLEKAKEAGAMPEEIVFVGDLNDRGPNTKGVVDYILNGELKTLFPDSDIKVLAGNHDDMMRGFLLDEEITQPSSYGYGTQTVNAYDALLGRGVHNTLDIIHDGLIDDIPIDVIAGKGNGFLATLQSYGIDIKQSYEFTKATNYYQQNVLNKNGLERVKAEAKARLQGTKPKNSPNVVNFYDENDVRQKLLALMPQDHIDFFTHINDLTQIKNGDFVITHSSIPGGADISSFSDTERLWMRSDKETNNLPTLNFDSNDGRFYVPIYGHTRTKPLTNPHDKLSDAYINLDTSGGRIKQGTDHAITAVYLPARKRGEAVVNKDQSIVTFYDSNNNTREVYSRDLKKHYE